MNCDYITINYRRTCEETAEKLLLFVRRQEIRIRYLETLKPDTNIDMVIPLNGIKSAFSLAWNRDTNTIFWTDIEKYTINRALLDGSNQSIIASTSMSKFKITLIYKKACY